jgi:hypothetical protein
MVTTKHRASTSSSSCSSSSSQLHRHKFADWAVDYVNNASQQQQCADSNASACLNELRIGTDARFCLNASPCGKARLGSEVQSDADEGSSEEVDDEESSEYEQSSSAGLLLLGRYDYYYFFCFRCGLRENFLR